MSEPENWLPLYSADGSVKLIPLFSASGRKIGEAEYMRMMRWRSVRRLLQACLLLLLGCSRATAVSDAGETFRFKPSTELYGFDRKVSFHGDAATEVAYLTEDGRGFVLGLDGGWFQVDPAVITTIADGAAVAAGCKPLRWDGGHP